MQGDSALGRAVAVQRRAATVGFDWPDAQGPIAKVKEELAEVEREEGSRKREALADEIGDLLFAVVNLARKLDIDPTSALEGANDKFVRRFEQLEQLAATRGVQLERASLELLDAMWDEIKTGGKGGKDGKGR
jgi:ATP diphosphatase